MTTTCRLEAPLRNASDQVNKHIWFDFHACRVLTLDQMACAIVPSDLDGVAWKQACTALIQPDGQCRYSQGVRQMKMNAPDRETSVDRSMAGCSSANVAPVGVKKTLDMAAPCTPRRPIVGDPTTAAC